jgi:hypothetical protein
LAAVILFLSLAVLSVPLGFLCVNLLLWILPPIRAALDRAEARAGGSFASANAQLLRFAAIAALILVPVCALAIRSSIALSDSRIYYRADLFSPMQPHEKSEIAQVLPRCTPGGRSSWNIGLDIAMRDGVTFDLAVLGPWFSGSSDRILAWLKDVPLDNSGIDPACPVGLKKLLSP